MTVHAIRQTGHLLEQLFVAAATGKDVSSLQDELRAIAQDSGQEALEAVHQIIGAADSMLSTPAQGMIHSAAIGEFLKYGAILMESAQDPGLVT